MSKGFTVIELIMVIVIVGILAVMVIPRMIATDTISARESAEMVAADIRRTQDLAMAGTTDQNISFTTGSSSYTTGTQTVSLPAGVTINTTTIITFTRLGVASATPTYIVNVGGVTVTVTQTTGRVTIS